MKTQETPTGTSLILIREWEQQMSSSGCCGRLEGDLVTWNGQRCFPERREIMEGAGTLYRAVRDRHGDGVRVRIVDPRNLISLLPILLGDFVRYGVGPWTAARTLFGLSVSSVVLNGRLLSRGPWPEPEWLLRRIEEG